MTADEQIEPEDKRIEPEDKQVEDPDEDSVAEGGGGVEDHSEVEIPRIEGRLAEERERDQIRADAADLREAGEIPSGRVRRSARLGTALGGEAARYAGTMAANVARTEGKAEVRMESRHLDAAIRMASLLGEMKGPAMKLGQMASFIDIDFVPEEYRDIYQHQLAKLRSQASAMSWEDVEEVLDSEYEGRPLQLFFASFERQAFAAASIGQVHRATLLDGTPVAVKIQYPGIDGALKSDLANAGMVMRLGKALAPGLDAKAVAAELRERVLEELDYEYEAQNQRAFARAYDGHPFICVPKVHTKISRRRVLVSDYVEGRDFEQVKALDRDERDIFGEIVFRFCYGSLYRLRHFNADTHPGNYLLMDDGRVAFLDFGMTKKLSSGQILLGQRVIDAASRNDPEGLRSALHNLGVVNRPERVDAERLLQHIKIVAGWYTEDREIRLDPKWVLKLVEATADPRSEFYDLVRRENLPAEELMGRRMETGLLAVLAQLGAGANWHRMMREWVYGDEPSTILGAAESRFFERRGIARVAGLGATDPRFSGSPPTPD